MTPAISLAITLLAATTAAGRKMDTSLGGLKIGARFQESTFDAKQNLYLLSSGECDGAHLRLVLSSDHKAMMLNEGALYEGLDQWDIDQRVRQFKQEHKPGKIMPKTNNGVRLGMTEADVLRVLGKPKKAIYSKKFQARELIYRREVVWPKKKGAEPLNGTGMRWSNYYLFRNGRLFYIELCQDLVGGAC
ncbi:MAG: hypothetical protein ABL962_01655 [Fimbriimonadaceae bacterium]